MAKTRDCNSLAQIGKTISDVIAEGGQFWHLDNVLTASGIRDSIKLTDAQLVDYLGKLGVGGSQIAASAETLLSNAGDFFDFDASALNPPVSGRQVIPVVLEKGTSGGELIGQENEYNQTYPVVGAGNYASLALASDTGILYAPPFADTQFLKIDPITKTSAKIGGIFSAGNKYGRAAYDPVTKKIFATNGASGAGGFGIAVLDTTNETTTTIAAGGNTHAGIIRASDGFMYVLTFLSGVNSQLKRIDPNTLAVTNYGNPLIGSGSGGDYIDIIQAGDFIYTVSFLSTVRNVAKIDITAGGTPSWSTFSITGSETYLTPIKLGNFIYWCALNGGNNILKWNTVNDIGTFINVGKTGFQGSALLSNGLLYFFPRTTTGFLELDPSDDSFRTLGNKTGIAGALAANDLIFTPPFTNTRVTEFDLISPFINNPSNPNPYNSVTNLFDTAGNNNRLASLEDYNVDFTEDGGGNITNIRVTMLTEGAKNVTLNLVYSGF